MEILAPVEFSADEIKSMTEKVGGVIVWGGATNIAPADDKLIRVEYPLSLDPSCQLLASRSSWCRLCCYRYPYRGRNQDLECGGGQGHGQGSYRPWSQAGNAG